MRRTRDSRLDSLLDRAWVRLALAVALTALALVVPVVLLAPDATPPTAADTDTESSHIDARQAAGSLPR